ncbi:MAG: hypothetical protein V2I46_05835 [Bacteroides sp.]|jgi:hypothetical protein|nr:hypothetical protein [Bacteroides sp.]
MIEALYAILWIYFMVLAIKHLPFFREIPGLPTKTLIAIFLIKVAAGTVFIFIYTHYYEPRTADVYRYFNEGRVLSGALLKNPIDYLRMLTGIGADAPHLQGYYDKMPYWWDPELYPVYNDNRLMIRYNALLNLLSFGKIHVNSVIANFVSLAGLVAIYKFTLRHLAENKVKLLKYGVFLFPSMIFWGSGLIKEILLIPVMGFFIYFSDRIFSKERLKSYHYLVYAALVFLFLLLKVYVLLLLIPCLAAFYLAGKVKRPSVGSIFPMVILSAAIVVLMLGWLFPQFDPFTILAKRQNFFMRFSVYVKAGSLIEEVYLDPNLTSIISYIPRALFNVLFRPHLLDSANPIILSAAVENLGILAILGLTGFYGFRKKRLDRLEWFGIWFTLLLFIFIGITTQVYGTLVRFKIPALPFLWVAFISLLPREKTNSRFFTSKRKIFQKK